MAGMTATTIRSFVRTSLDVDAEDIPDSLLDVWMQDAVTRIISHFGESPVWLQVEYTFTTVPSVQSYNLDTTEGLKVPQPLQTVDEVRSPLFSLTPRQHRQVRESYRTDSPSGRPQEFSLWNRDLFLWPKPVAAEAIQVLGIRKPDWNWITTGSGAPDMPEEFHTLIAHWSLARAYAQQDDPEMANFFRGEFASTLVSTATRFINNVTALPMVMNGGRRHEPYRTARTLGPLIYDWE